MATKVIPVLPKLNTPEMHDDLAAHRRAVQHFIAHHDEFCKRYPHQWVAVWISRTGARTVEVDNSIEGLVQKARGKSLPIKRSDIRFMATERR